MLETLAMLLLAGLQPQEAKPEGKTSKWTGITLDVEYWMADLSGTTGAGYLISNPSGLLDLRNDLNLSTGGVQTYGLRYTQETPKGAEMTYGLEYRRGNWSGGGNLPEDLHFGGVTFSAGSAVASRCRLDDYTFEAWGSIPLDEGDLVRLIVGASVGVVWIEDRLTGTVQADSVLGVDFQYGFLVGLRVRPWPFAYGEVTTGVGAGYLESISIDLKVAVGAQWGPFRVELGYRFEFFKQFDLDATLGGFFVGLAGDF